MQERLLHSETSSSEHVFFAECKCSFFVCFPCSQAHQTVHKPPQRLACPDCTKDFLNQQTLNVSAFQRSFNAYYFNFAENKFTQKAQRLSAAAAKESAVPVAPRAGRVARAKIAAPAVAGSEPALTGAEPGVAEAQPTEHTCWWSSASTLLELKLLLLLLLLLDLPTVAASPRCCSSSPSSSCCCCISMLLLELNLHVARAQAAAAAAGFHCCF